MRQILFIYFMKNLPGLIKQAVPEHIEYWKNTSPEGYKGGPFSDRSGGMITFMAQSIEEASELVRNDPFVKEGLLDKSFIKEWLVE